MGSHQKGSSGNNVVDKILVYVPDDKVVPGRVTVAGVAVVTGKSACSGSRVCSPSSMRVSVWLGPWAGLDRVDIGIGVRRGSIAI